MKILLILILVSVRSYASFPSWKQYPEDRTYTNSDRGMRPYRSLSLYKSGTYTLTFDDGPDLVKTPKILDILKRYNIQATFFVLTKLVNDKTFPIVKRMLDEGHIVASHGPTHDRSGDLTKAEWKRQTKLSFQDLARWYKLAGHAFTKHYYRFPYGSYGTREDYHHINALKEVSHELMGDNCIHMVFWDVDTSDWVPGMTPTEVAQNIVAWNEGGLYIDFKREGNSYVKNPVYIQNPLGGGVILQHDVQEPSIKGLEIFLKYAQEKNLNLARLDEVDEFKISKDCRL